MGSKIQRELALLLTGKDVSWSKTTRQAEKSIDRLGGHVRKGGGAMARNLGRAGTLAGAGFVAGLGYSIKTAIDKESAVAGVAKTVEGDVSDIIKGLERLSTTGPTSFNELAGLAEQAGALGIAKGDIVAFTDVAAKLGATTNVSALDAATALGQLSNTMNLSAADYERFGSALVDLGNKGTSSEAQILEVERRAGGAAHALGIATDKTLGWAAAAANLGMQQELAGSSLDRFFTISQRAVSDGGKKLEVMAKTAGVSAEEFKKAFDRDASGALETFMKGLGRLPKDRRLRATQALFGKGTGINRLVRDLASSFDRNLSPSLDTATDAWDANVAMNEEAAKRFGTTASVIATLRNNVDLAASTIGGELLPVLADLSKQGIVWLQEHQGDIKEFAVDLAEGFKQAVAWAQKLDWDQIGKTMKTVVGTVGSIGEAFMGLPDWVKTAVLTGWGLNKLTDGAVIDIGTDLGKVVFDAFAGRGSSPANPLHVVGPGLGGPGAPGGKVPPVVPPGAVVPLIGAGVAFDPAMFDDQKRKFLDKYSPAGPAGKLPEEERQLLTNLKQSMTDRLEANRETMVTTQMANLTKLAEVQSSLGGKLTSGVAATRGVTAAVRAKDLSVSVATSVAIWTTAIMSTRAIRNEAVTNSIRTHDRVL